MTLPGVHARAWTAALLCGLSGGCVVTSAAEFVEEPRVPPIIVDTKELPLGSILTFEKATETELRVGITVRDDNIDDVLQLHAQIRVADESEPEHICPPVDIQPNGQPLRDRFDVVVDGSKIRAHVCNRLEIYVSRQFIGSCTNMQAGFTWPVPGESVAKAQFQIWEVSDEPGQDPAAAIAIVTSCFTVAS